MQKGRGVVVILGQIKGGREYAVLWSLNSRCLALFGLAHTGTKSYAERGLRIGSSPQRSRSSRHLLTYFTDYANRMHTYPTTSKDFTSAATFQGTLANQRAYIQQHRPIAIHSVTDRGNLTESVVKMVRELVEARLDELLHRGGLVNDALHHVVDRLNLNGSPAPAHLFLVCGANSNRCRTLLLL